MKNAPTTRRGNESAIPGRNSANSTLKTLRLSPRQHRVLSALVHALSHASPWIKREQIDRIAHCSNGPDVVLRLREKLGSDAIDMRREEVTDYDGRPSNPGKYRLTPIGLQRLAELGGVQ